MRARRDEPGFTRARRDERGFVLITAMIVLAVFMVLTVAIVTIVNVQTDQTGHERSGEAAFNLADGALQAEADQLQLAWPAVSTQALPACSQSTPQETGCEGTTLAQQLQATTPGPDYAPATWSAQAFDDTQAAYSPTLASTAPAWDANGDNTMWVRAQATANGQTRTVVEQLTRRLVTVSLPENVVTAGGLSTQSNGTPTIIEASDPASGVTGPVDVRCGTAGDQPAQTGSCLGWQPNQLSPPTAYSAGYVDPAGSGVLTSAQIQGLVETAAANGTLYDTDGASYVTSYGTFAAHPGCPPGPTSGIVVVAGTGTCSYTGNVTWNSAAAPGALVFLAGSLSLGGSEVFDGLLYMANQNGASPAAGSVCTAAQLSSAPTLVTTSGSALVNGAIFVAGCGLVSLQDNGDALNFSLNALQALRTYAAANPAPGTFRVVPK
jgi:type II secretory pathway pseudopilin PulG